MPIGKSTGQRRPLFGQRLAALAVLALLALASCGAQSGSALDPSATPTPTTPWKWTKWALTPQPQKPVPTPVPPYALPHAWQRPASGPAWVSGFAFAASTPEIGYACTVAPSALDGLTPTPDASPADAYAFYATRDGGQTWVPAANVPFERCQYPSPVVVDQMDANDVFVAQGMTPAATGQETYALWRSRDGGVAWSRLTAPGTNAGYPPLLDNLAVVGSRLVAQVSYEGEGAPANALFASDDGGRTWQPFGVNIADQHVNADGFVALGTVLVVASTPPSSQGDAGSYAQRVSEGYPSPLVAEQAACGSIAGRSGSACGGPPAVVVYWRTVDGGRTWTTAHVPGLLPRFTRAATGSGYYGVLVNYIGDNGSATIYWSRDSGNSWTPLPALEGAGEGYVNPTALGEVAIAGDGTVFVGTWHDVRAPDGSIVGTYPAGVFILRPTDPSLDDGSPAAWQPLAPEDAQGWQAVLTSAGMRLWGIRVGSPPALLDVDLTPSAGDVRRLACGDLVVCHPAKPR